MPWAGLCRAWHQQPAPQGRRVAILLGRPPTALAIAGFLGCDLDNVFSLLNKPSGNGAATLNELASIVPLLFTHSPFPTLPRAGQEFPDPLAARSTPQLGTGQGLGAATSAFWGHIVQSL